MAGVVAFALPAAEHEALRLEGARLVFAVPQHDEGALVAFAVDGERGGMPAVFRHRRLDAQRRLLLRRDGDDARILGRLAAVVADRLKRDVRFERLAAAVAEPEPIGRRGGVADPDVGDDFGVEVDF